VSVAIGGDLWIDECPIRACATLSGSFSPPSTRRLTHHDAQKCREACNPLYFALSFTLPVSGSPLAPVFLTSPAAIMAGCKQAFDTAGPAGEDKAKLARRAGQFPLA
jgi:hypothetical protein